MFGHLLIKVFVLICLIKFLKMSHILLIVWRIKNKKLPIFYLFMLILNNRRVWLYNHEDDTLRNVVIIYYQILFKNKVNTIFIFNYWVKLKMLSYSFKKINILKV